MNCLILDDYPETAEMLADRLRAMGRRADAVSDPTEAMLRLRDGKYNCLGVDYFLPETTGVEVVRWLRASDEERLRAMPVMVMTAGCDEVVGEIEVELRDLQPAAVIRKPFFPTAFLEEMQRLRGEAADFRGNPGPRPEGVAVAEGVGGPQIDRPDSLRPGGPGAGAE